jgi:CHAT domain-containing protein/tetratricopeptide (TPR) repeat protein
MRATRTNRRRNWWLAVVLAWLLGGDSIVRPAAPPPPGLTAEQRERLKERGRLSAEVQTLQQKGRLAEAVESAQRLLALERAVFGDVHEDVARSLGLLARLHLQREDFPAARRALEEGLAIRTKLHGEKDWRVTDARLALADVDRLARLGREERTRLAAADRRYEEVVQLYRQGRYAEAVPLAREVLATRKAVLGERHNDYASSLNILGMLYRDMGEYGRALPLLEEAWAISRATLGEGHPSCGAGRSNLGLLYWSTGEYAKALPHLEGSREIAKATLGEKHPNYALCLNNLGLLYKDMGEYAKALPLFEQARAIQKGDPSQQSSYAATLNNLAMLYKETGEPAKALPLYEETRSILKAILGEKHPRYAASLNNLGQLHKDRGEHAKALPLLEQARAILEAALGAKHPFCAANLNNLGLLYEDMGEYTRAKALFEQARDTTRSALGEKHPNYALCLENLAMLTYRLEDRAGAEALSQRAFNIQRTHLDDTFGVLSERERLTRIRQLDRHLNIYLSIALGPEADAARLYAPILAWKGAVASRHQEDRLALDQPDLRPLLDQLRLARTGLARLTASPPPPARQKEWLQRFRDLEADKEDAERKLAAASAAFRRLQQQRRAGAADVARVLPPGTVFVDFVEYIHGRPPAGKPGPFRGERRVLAVVLARDRKPRCVPLGTAEPIDRAVRAWREPMQPGQAGQPPEDAARELRRLVWQPLTEHLGSASTVLLAPDGALCGLPFAALPGQKPDSFLIEEQAIGYVTSGRHLLELAAGPGTFEAEGLLALGGLDYGRSSIPAAASRQQADRLLGTRLEAERVCQDFRARFPDAARPRLLKDDAADKPSLLRALAVPAGTTRWRYLHLATHGFFAPPDTPLGARERSFDDERDTLTFVRNPMLLSGLLLSGANRSAAGVLTAEEVSGLDLRGTDLVVLSACETGLGKTISREGVLGLQRGFQAAGARTLVSSLWSVSDPATSVLMEQFYTNLWQKRLSKLEALRQAQLTVLRHPELVEARRQGLLAEVKKKGWRAVALRGLTAEKVTAGKPGADRRSPPAWWAAFVLSGDPR